MKMRNRDIGRLFQAQGQSTEMHNVNYERTDKGDNQVNPGYYSKGICGKHFLDKIS